MIKFIETVGNIAVNLIGGFFQSLPIVGDIFVAITRWVIVVLVLLIIIRAVKSLLSDKSPSEIWAYLALDGGTNIPLTHWENVIGRAKSSDIVLRLPPISKSHALLVRKEDGRWIYTDLNSKTGSFLNNEKIQRPVEVKSGDKLTIGGLPCQIIPASLSEKLENIKIRKKTENAMPPWKSLIALTIIQVIMTFQFIIAFGTECPPAIPFFFGAFTLTMWVYCVLLKFMNNGAFEMEIIAFFLCTLSLAIVATSDADQLYTQFLAIVLGMILYIALCWFLRDLQRALKIRIFLVFASVALLLDNIIFGITQFGSTNWIEIAGLSVQPSEVVKIAFIFIGSATLDELYQKKNLTLFILFSGFCFVALGIMGDFGTALIFFVTFAVISFLRSGQFSKLILLVGTAGIAGFLVLMFKPYVAERFITWGNAWEAPDAGGYQQTRTMSATASGGMSGVGGGEGWLSYVGAADKDLIFGVIAEEWGLIVALLAILCIITFSLFAYKSIQLGRSTFYTIAACGTSTLLIFQTSLNVLGALDIVPLTGVTFPFVSNGGTSMVACWGLLAFIKATDTRESASMAVRKLEKEKIGGGNL